MYCTVQEVYEATSLTSTEVPEVTVTAAIKSAEIQVDRNTFTTYWAVNNDAQTVVSATADTVTVSASSYTENELVGMNVWVYSGTGINQILKILSNTTDTITVEANWDTNPVADDKFRVCYSASDAHYINSEDGNGFEYFFVPVYPIKETVSLTIADTAITDSLIYSYDEIGKLVLNRGAEKHKFSNVYPQEIDLNYWYGVYPLPYDVKRFVTVIASCKVLAAQMGGTFDTPSTYSLPEGSVTIGQAYINIKTTFDVLKNEATQLLNNLIKYPTFV